VFYFSLSLAVISPRRKYGVPCRTRFYATSLPMRYIIKIWCILRPAPITVNPSHPTIPHRLTGSVVERTQKYLHAKADSRPGACDDSTFFVMNKWCLVRGGTETKHRNVCVSSFMCLNNLSRFLVRPPSSLILLHSVLDVVLGFFLWRHVE